MEGLKSQQVQDFVITQIRNEKEEQQRDISVQRLLEIVKTLESEEDVEDEDEDLDDEDDEEEELDYQPGDKDKTELQVRADNSNNYVLKILSHKRQAWKIRS